MRLMQIKLAGFKSFVDPTTVSFPGNRCAVVGPNGCGKSNIIDAVRWVMGESSAGKLRGENSTDVIFSGSSTRKPTSTASIELLFNNEDGRITGEFAGFSEISIRRQVSRDSQSSYFLNGSRCRRRDILDIFLGTGFGPRSYSIIEQGMISQLVEAKPEELRVYLEEAAGISKYKERRRETENRIKHTKENLERLEDIREELERQLNHLQRQAKAAERYRELKTDERRQRAELVTLRLIRLEADLASFQERIGSLEVELERSRAQQQALDTNIEKQRTEHADKNEAFNVIQGQFYELGAVIARTEESIQYNAERVKQLELDLEHVFQRGAEANRQLGMDETQIAELQTSIGELRPNVEQAAKFDEEMTAELEKAETAAKELQTAWEKFNQDSAANDRNAEVQVARIEHLEQLLQRLHSRQDYLLNETQTYGKPDDSHVDTLAGEITERERHLSALDVDVDVCLKDLAAAREDLMMREQVLEDARGQVQNLRHELASLDAVQQAALGRNQTDVTQWIEEQHLDSASRLGECLSVVSGWEKAVENVLRSQLQAIKVDDVSAYSAVLTNFQSGELALFEGHVVVDDTGELPSLANFIRTEGLELGGLLNGVFAAESVKVAFAHRDGLKAHQSIVTRDGVWVGKDWLRVMRMSAEESGIIERTHELEVLNLQVEQAEQNLAELQGHVVEGRARIESLGHERMSLQTRITEYSQQLGELRADHGVRKVRIEEAGVRRDIVDKERTEIEEQLQHETDRLNQARKLLAEAETNREASQVLRVAIENDRRQSEETVADARLKAREVRDRFHNQNAELLGMRSRLTANRTAKDRLIAQQEEFKRREEELRAGIDVSTTPLPELQQSLAAKLQERLAVETQLSEVRDDIEAIDAKVRELESGRTEAEAATEQIRESLESARVEKQGLSVHQTNLQEQFGATGLDASLVRREMDETANEDEWVELLEKTDRRINRLGPINLAAIDEFDTQSERKSYLDSQHEDLVEALETLESAIKKIDLETKRRFKATFDEVNRRLGELFPKVFGGGHAYLELTGEDLLDTGVSLMARPPGKRNTSVHLLSGGEKAMTAVALIFAIFQLNPSPVCLLDEVDAPLDDVNVMRFASLIKDMSANVQFVVITHNKITMEMADHLMGVTMNEPGVSRLVSVDVEEAAAMVAS